MTRETKIGLLVGLCFIIVIGILLSDHFRATMEPPEAQLANAGQNVRNALNGPGNTTPQITIVTPSDAPPPQPVPTHDELQPQTSPVVPSPIAANPQGQSPVRQPTMIDQSQQPNSNQSNQVAGADGPRANQTLNDAARAQGEALIPAGIDGRPTGTATTISAGTYKAQSGDTVSRMAAKFMGSSSRANVQAIINANPSLREDPDTVIVGQSYVIPGRTSQISGGNQTAGAPMPQQSTMAPPAGQYFYTVQEGDSLWRIANDQLGDPSAVSALKELNASVLKGKDGDVVTPGMKLRLPARPIASAS